MTGPEVGTIFCVESGACGGPSDPYSNWDAGEPNNGTSENYLHMIGNLALNEGTWNNLPVGGGAGAYVVQGYVVEYGDSAGDPSLQLSGTVTVNVEKTVPSFEAGPFENNVAGAAFSRSGNVESSIEVYQNDFESGAGAEWSNPSTATFGPSPHSWESLPTGLSCSTYRGLPGHDEVTVSFDLLILKTMDGSKPPALGPDVIDVSADGGTLMHTTFRQSTSTPQAYPGTYPDDEFAGYTGAIEVVSTNFSLYRLTFTFAHTNGTLGFDFTGTGMQGVADESCGLDDVQVSVLPVAGTDTFTGTGNYGDGTGDQTLTITSGAYDLSHDYTAVGSYTVEVILCDSGGACRADTFAKIVTSVDDTPPTITATPGPGPNINTLNNTDVTVNFAASDGIGGSGVKEIVYTVDGGTPVVTSGDLASAPLSSEGVHIVSYLATDNAGNSSTPATVTVRIDKTAPAVTAPDDVVEEATDADGALVNYSGELATDDVGVVTLTCLPASGTLFAIQITEVVCTATDLAGNEGSASFDVTVQDTTAPSFIFVPDDVTVDADGLLTSVDLGGPATASDAVDPSPAVSNDAPDRFPLGVTNVIWTATDYFANSSTATQVVTVDGPRARKQDVIDLLSEFEDESKRIEKAIRELNKGLEDKLWLNGFHDPRQGKKVFDRERHAVKELMHLIKEAPKGKGKGKKGKYDVSDDALQASSDAIDALVAIDQSMAQAAIDEAKAAEVVDPTRQDKVDKEIDKAEKELGKGDSEFDKGKPKFDKAIDYYTKAWKHAQHGIKEAAKVPGPGKGHGDKSDPLNIAGLSPGEAIDELISYIGTQVLPNGLGPSLIVDLDAVSAALGDDQASIGLLNAFVDRVEDEKENHQLNGKQARALRQSAEVIISIIEAGPWRQPFGKAQLPGYRRWLAELGRTPATQSEAETPPRNRGCLFAPHDLILHHLETATTEYT